MSAVSLILICALLLLPGLWLRPKRADFFLAGKQAGSFTVGCSLLATCLGASAILGLTARSYTMGWSAFWWLGAGSIGLLLLAFFWVPSMRKRDTVQTLPQWLEDGYGLPARTLAAMLIAVMWIGVIAAQFAAAGAILSVMLNWSISTGILATATAVAFYTTWGGQTAVLRTDKLQILLILLAVFMPLTLLALTGKMPTVQLTTAGLNQAEAISTLHVLALIVVVGGMYIVGPDLCSRVLTAESHQKATRGACGAGIVLLPIAAAIVLLGLALRDLAPPLQNAAEALPWLISRSGLIAVPFGLLINAGLLAAMLSSADTCLLTAASVCELDLLGRQHSSKKQQLGGRIAVILIAGLSTAVALYRPQIIPNILLAYSFYSGGLLVPLLLLRWPKAVKAVPRSWIWGSIIAGGLLPVLLLLKGTVADSAVAGLGGVALSAFIIATGWFVGLLKKDRHP